MPRILFRVTLLTTLLATAACTQQGAQIELRGQNNYGRSGATNSFASNAAINPSRAVTSYNAAPISNSQPAYVTGMHAESTQSTAQIQSIGSNDLPPPSATASASKAKPVAEASTFSDAKTVESRPVEQKVASNEPAQRVNPWTKKSRTADNHGKEVQLNLKPTGKADQQPMVSDMKTASAPPNDKAVAQLDRIVSSDSSKASSKVASSDSFIWPVNSKKVISAFGPKGGGKANDGINIASADGEPVWAAADGEVVYVGNELAGYGNMVLIKHAGNKSTSYAHLNRATVEKYDRVKQGDIIGYVGSTGSVKAPQLHFALRDGKEPVDPRKFLSRNVASLH